MEPQGEINNGEKEIHKTEFIDKQLPTIYYEKTTHKSMTNSTNVVLKVSDTTSEKAVKTFREIQKELKV